MGKKRTFGDDEAETEPTEAKESTDGGSKGKKKALPPGYVCKACGMKDDHAIYNCTLAIKKTKTEKQEEKEKVEVTTAAPEAVPASAPTAKSKPPTKPVAEGAAVPSSSSDANVNTSNPLTAFITGLPFKTSRTKVIDIFQKEGFASDLTGKEVKLVMFEDRPEKCRGLAYVTFTSEEDYQKALALSGQEYEGRTLKIVPCAPFSKGPSTPFESKSSNIKGAFKGRSKLPEGVVKITRCYRCGEMHDPNQCTNKRICYKCKSTEHLSSQCPFKKPKPTPAVTAGNAE